MDTLGLYRLVRLASAVVLVGTAIRHVMLAMAGSGSALRHWAFVLIDLAVAALLVFRPRWAFLPTLALGMQQLVSHGLDLSESFLGTAPLDKLSLAVCLFFPTLVTVLYLEREEWKEAEGR